MPATIRKAEYLTGSGKLVADEAAHEADGNPDVRRENSVQARDQKRQSRIAPSLTSAVESQVLAFWADKSLPFQQELTESHK